jgi:DNA-binding CsgD family transcriptional regulator
VDASEDLALAETFQDAVQTVRVAVERLGVQRCEVELQPISSPGANRLALPVLRPRGWFATIVCSNDAGFTLEQVHELVLIATRLSVWCTERSFGPEEAEAASLPPRQYEVAALAARGSTNAEIAAQLGISINTVKVRLKQVFERLHVDNRTELANVLRAWTAAPSVNKLSRKSRRA